MSTFDQIVTGDKLLYHDKEFRKKIKSEMPSKTSDLSNDDYTVKDAHYVHTDNNYTTDQVNKLSGIESGAEVNVIEKISLNGAVQTVKNKAVALTVDIPTKVSQLTNDAGYKTTDTNTTYKLSKSGSTVTLTGSDGSTTSVADSNTTYSSLKNPYSLTIQNNGTTVASYDGSTAKTANFTNATTSANGLMSAADKKAVDREFFRMLPKGGTVIPNGANLNSTAYLKVGNYYQPANVNTTNMTNIPFKAAFMMYVLSPLSEVYDNESTAQWVYRLRIFITYTGRSIFTQMVNSESTAGSFGYGPWVKMTNSNDLGAVSNTIDTHIANKSNPHDVTKAQVGLGSVANLDQSKAIKSITRSGTTFTATALDGTKTTFTQQDSNTTYSVATSSADGLMSKSDKAKLDGISSGAEIQWEKIYPVGSIYISANSTSPAELFGGTWERIKDVFLLAAGDTHAAGSTGGEEQHKLTISELPPHSHAVAPLGAKGGTNGNLVINDKYGAMSGADTLNLSGGNAFYARNTSIVGERQAHNNMPPYLTVYMWQRTA